MDTRDNQKPVYDLKNVERPQRIRPPFVDGFNIDKMNQRKRIKPAYIVIGRIGFYEHKPQNFQDFRNKEDIFGSNDYTPTLRICDTIAEHEASYPDDKCYDKEFPKVYKWNGQELYGAYCP